MKAIIYFWALIALTLLSIEAAVWMPEFYPPVPVVQIQRDVFDESNMLYYGSSGVTAAQHGLGVPSKPFSTGLILNPTKVPAHYGFAFFFSWQTSECSLNNTSEDPLGGDGFAIVFLKDLPTNEQVAGSIGTLGIGKVPHAYVFGYSSIRNEFYVCHWNDTPISLQQQGMLRDVCQVFPYNTPISGCDPEADPAAFFLIFLNDRITLSSGASIYSIPFEMDAVDYYVGVGFGNDNYYRKQELLELYYAYVDFKPISRFDISTANVSTDLFYCDSAGPIGNSIRLIPSEYYRQGSVILKYVVNPSHGFFSKFIFTPSECMGIGGEGFSLFFALRYAAEECHSYNYKIDDEFPHITISYSIYTNKFAVCNYQGNFPEIGAVENCTQADNILPLLTCGASYNFNVYFIDNIIQVFVNDTLVLVSPLQFEDRWYFPGFAASSHGSTHYQQVISDWTIDTDLSSVNITELFPPVTPITPETPISPPIYPVHYPIAPHITPVTPPVNLPPIDPPVTPPIDPIQCPAEAPQTSPASNFVFLNDASLVNQSIRLTPNGGSGLVCHLQPLSAEEGTTLYFVSRFTWTPTNCDTVYNGADGWTFFLSKDIPTLEHVQSSSGGRLGIQSVPNVVMAAYSATFNEFWISNWTTPFTGNLRWESVRVLVSGPKYSCGGSYDISITYNYPSLTMRLNTQVVISSQVELDQSALYYFGLSGATGGGYFQQDFTNWSITRPAALV